MSGFCSGLEERNNVVDRTNGLSARTMAIRAFSLLLDIPGEACSGVFIAENAHRCTNPVRHLREKCSTAAIIAGVAFSGVCFQARAAAPQPAEPKLPSMIQQFSADRRSLESAYVIPFSASRLDRMEAFYQQEQKQLAAVDFKALVED